MQGLVANRNQYLGKNNKLRAIEAIYLKKLLHQKLDYWYARYKKKTKFKERKQNLFNVIKKIDS